MSAQQQPSKLDLDELQHRHDDSTITASTATRTGWSTARSCARTTGVKAVGLSLLILGLTAARPGRDLRLSGSVALLADLIHNFGDALTAIPLGIAFFLRSVRGEKLAGLAVVLAIFVSACVALYETIMRFIHPQQISHLWVLAAAGVIGFVGNELAAQVRLGAGRRLASAGDDRRRQARAHRRVRLARRRRERDRGRARRCRSPIRSSASAITLVILKSPGTRGTPSGTAEIDLEHVDDH